MIFYNTHYRDRFRTGMSLLELMVVIVILGLLAVSIIPAIDANDERKAREAAITVSSLVASANSRARQTNDGAGIWLEPLDKSATSTTPSRGSADLFVAQPGDPYTGEDSVSYVFLNPIPNSNLVSQQAVAVFSLQTCPNIESYCDLYSQIYIEGRLYYLTLPAPAPFYQPSFLPPPYDNGTQSTATIKIGLITTILPDTDAIPTSSPAYSALDAFPKYPALDPGHPTFRIDNSPTRSSTAPLSLPNGYVVDIAWSSYGNMLFIDSRNLLDGTPDTFTGIDYFLPSEPVVIMFNSIGNIQELRYRILDSMGQKHDCRIYRNADVFLLIGRADRAGNPFVQNPTENNPGANWQYPDSRWIKISRSGGAALISDTVPSVNNNVTDVLASQQFVRRSLGASRN